MASTDGGWAAAKSDSAGLQELQGPLVHLRVPCSCCKSVGQAIDLLLQDRQDPDYDPNNPAEERRGNE